MPRVALWGGASLDNIGDQLLMTVTAAELGRRLPDAKFGRFCPWSDGGGIRPLWVDKGGRWPGTGGYDAVVALGGIWAGPPFRIFLMQVFSLGPNPAIFDPDVFVAWHGVGIVDGCPPLSRDVWQAYVRALAWRLDHLTVRSRDTAARFAVATGQEPPVIPDPAFALPPLPCVDSRRGYRRLRVGVAIGGPGASLRLRERLTDQRYWNRCHWSPATCYTSEEIEAYECTSAGETRTKAFLNQVWPALREVANLADVEFLSIRNIYADDEVAARGVGLVPGARMCKVTADGADGVTRALARYDVVVVSRFHSVVLALRAGVPFVAVDPYWSSDTGTSKVHQLLRELGAEERYWTHRGHDTQSDLASVVARALAAEVIEPDLYHVMRARAQRSFDRLADVLRVALAVRHPQGHYP
jgi:hypothetical protein